MSKACLNIRPRALVEEPSLLTTATQKRLLKSVNEYIFTQRSYDSNDRKYIQHIFNTSRTFRDFKEQSSFGEFLITKGRAFHNRGAETENAQRLLNSTRTRREQRKGWRIRSDKVKIDACLYGKTISIVIYKVQGKHAGEAWSWEAEL